MKVRGATLPTADEMYWEASATRLRPDGSLAFWHRFLTHENAAQLKAVFGEAWLTQHLRNAEAALERWAQGCHETVQ